MWRRETQYERNSAKLRPKTYPDAPDMPHMLAALSVWGRVGAAARTGTGAVGSNPRWEKNSAKAAVLSVVPNKPTLGGEPPTAT